MSYPTHPTIPEGTRVRVFTSSITSVRTLGFGEVESFTGKQYGIEGVYTVKMDDGSIIKVDKRPIGEDATKIERFSKSMRKKR